MQSHPDPVKRNSFLKIPNRSYKEVQEYLDSMQASSTSQKKLRRAMRDLEAKKKFLKSAIRLFEFFLPLGDSSAVSLKYWGVVYQITSVSTSSCIPRIEHSNCTTDYQAQQRYKHRFGAYSTRSIVLSPCRSQHCVCFWLSTTSTRSLSAARFLQSLYHCAWPADEFSWRLPRAAEMPAYNRQMFQTS